MPLDHRTLFAEESARFVNALRRIPTDRAVPSCPGWTAGDLLYHQADGLHFWAAIVADLLEDPTGVGDLERPADEELPEAVETQAAAFLAAIDDHDLSEACWSWQSDGHTVGWTLRRQAHEALIHRVDAELTAGRPVTAPGTEMAADCVDELIHMFVAGVPPWGQFTAENTAVRVETTDTGEGWTLRFGRFTGTSPNTGNTYDLDATEVAPDASPVTVIRGAAWDLATWAWGRGPEDHLAVEGERQLVQRLRTLIAEGTQ